MLLHDVVGVRRSVAQREHHAVVAQVEVAQQDIDPGALLRIEVELVGRVERTAELELDGGRTVVDVERLVDVALLVARNHLALDVVVGSLGPECGSRALELIFARVGLAQLERLGVVPARVLTRTREGTETIDKLLLEVENRDMGQTHARHLVLLPHLYLRRVEVVVAADGQQSDGRSQKYLNAFH